MTLSTLEEEITAATEKLSRSVVSIEATSYARSRRYNGEMIVPMQGAGSGVIIDELGHVITNNHVVSRSDVVSATLNDGRFLKGRMVGSDKATDIAVLKLENAEGQNLPFAKLGDSENLKVGQIALAIGNSLGLPGGPTVSLGVISALARPLSGADFIYEGFIQTDAAVNPGNSGGPLANLTGEVVGINTAIIPYANGMGFAIPINMVKRAVGQIIANGRVVRPWIGISAVDVTPAISRRYDLRATCGVMIIEVSMYSPAHEAGLRQGDVITRIDGKWIGKMKDLLIELSRNSVGGSIHLSILRSGRESVVSLRLLEMPATVLGEE
jgi:serine protease Do